MKLRTILFVFAGSLLFAASIIPADAKAKKSKTLPAEVSMSKQVLQDRSEERSSDLVKENVLVNWLWKNQEEKEKQVLLLMKIHILLLFIEINMIIY